MVASGWGLLELRPMRLSLEEIFLQVTTDESAPPPVAAGDSAAPPPAGDVAQGGVQ